MISDRLEFAKCFLCRSGARSIATRPRSQELAHVRVPHIVVIHRVDASGDFRGQNVPAQRGRVVRIEIVLAVPARATVLHDVLVLETDDDHEIAVLLDPSLGDRLDGLSPPVVVNREDAPDDRRGELSDVGQFALPPLDGGHGVPSSDERGRLSGDTVRRFGRVK